MQSSGQGMSSGGRQDMSMGGGVSSGMGSSGSNIVVQNNINIINQPIIVIATNAGGSSQTQQVASQIQAPAATHTVCYASFIPTPLGPCINMLKIQVTVGGEAGLVYSPDTIQAAMYDMVQFNFMAKNHTVTQSTFPKPCNKMMGGIDSGFMPNSGTGTPPMMMVQVNSTMPIWFYCRQKKPMPHCGAGMTFSINPTADKSQAAFKAAAIAINGTGATAGMMASGGSMAAGVSMAAGASMAAGTYMAAAASVAPAMTMATQASVAATTMAMAAQAAAATQAASVAQQNQGSMNSGSNSMMVSGSGQTDSSGSCTCSCMCGVQAFAAGSGLGLGMYGGLPGKHKTSFKLYVK